MSQRAKTKLDAQTEAAALVTLVFVFFCWPRIAFNTLLSHMQYLLLQMARCCCHSASWSVYVGIYIYICLCLFANMSHKLSNCGVSSYLYSFEGALEAKWAAWKLKVYISTQICVWVHLCSYNHFQHTNITTHKNKRFHLLLLLLHLCFRMTGNNDNGLLQYPVQFRNTYVYPWMPTYIWTCIYFKRKFVFNY